MSTDDFEYDPIFELVEARIDAEDLANRLKKAAKAVAKSLSEDGARVAPNPAEVRQLAADLVAALEGIQTQTLIVFKEDARIVGS